MPTVPLLVVGGEMCIRDRVYAGDKGLAQGVGRTKKEAESQAAKSTLARLSEFFGIGMTEEQAAELSLIHI